MTVNGKTYELTGTQTNGTTTNYFLKGKRGAEYLFWTMEVNGRQLAFIMNMGGMPRRTTVTDWSL
jgi:hypothetical protein